MVGDLRGRSEDLGGVMASTDIDDVLAIERLSFPTPWTREHFRHEIEDNAFAWNPVDRFDGRVVGYACVWFLDDEARINNVAIDPARRRAGLGSKLLGRVLEEAGRRGCREVTLEVRPSNAAARVLYERLGFRSVGRRRGYYQDTGEDAILMTLDLPVGTPSVERRAE